MGGRWAEWVAEESGRIRDSGRWREVRDLDGPAPDTVVHDVDGERPVVSFASNDYLGLTRHHAVVAAAREAVDRWGAGAGAARLVAGARPVHRRLEAALADWRKAEAAVLFATGYAANLGVLQALGGPGVTIVSDQLNHASIVDGCRLARCPVVVTPHADVSAVERAVVAAPGRVLVVTESVFSMDGDVASVDALVEMCARRDALLVVDEAHAVLGPAIQPSTGPVLRVGTLSKALASLGGFVAGPADLCAVLVNRSRSFVFTTASSPADTAAALAALSVARSPEGETLLTRLQANVERLAPGHPSPILPVPVGDEDAAMEASASLLEEGLLVPAIRPPTVPPGTARLRISLTAAHTNEQVDRLAAALGRAGLRGANPAAPRARHLVAVPARAARGEKETARPDRVVVVLGTTTGVGKTWVGAALAAALRADGTTVAARKPVQSFDGGGAPTDAGILAGATGEAESDVCPRHRWYEAPMAPPLAAQVLGRPPFILADLLAELRWPPGTAVGLVEGVGGPRSPLAADADNVALVMALQPHAVVLVADAGLGAINAVLLAADALLGPLVVVLNRYDPADPVHVGNRVWLGNVARLRVVTTIDELASELG